MPILQEHWRQYGEEPGTHVIQFFFFFPLMHRLSYCRKLHLLLLYTYEASVRLEPPFAVGAAAATPIPPSLPARCLEFTALPSLASWNRNWTLRWHSSQPLSNVGLSLSISPAIEAQLQSICDRHAHLSEQLGGERSSQLSPREIASINKELSSLDPVVCAAGEWRRAKAYQSELAALANDPSEDEAIRHLAREEQESTLERVPHMERELLLSLLPQDDDDERGVVLEVRAGTGGEEASLFAAELFRMYERYAVVKGWKFEVAEYSSSDMGGCKIASATVSAGGSSKAVKGGVYGRLKFESGVHRVQRVPATESGGRVHTSASSVVVLPQAGDVDVAVKDEDLRIDVYRAGGAGGQHVNTTNSAVRVTHLPSGLSVSIQDERSQHKNKAKALGVLRARLFDMERRRAAAAQSSARRQQIGSGDRSERVRTYNFPQGRVTDHRVGVTEHDIELVMNGELDAFVEALRVQHQAELLTDLSLGKAL